MPSRQERRKVSVASCSFLILIKRVEDHRTAGVEIDMIGVEARIAMIVRRPAIDAELLEIALCAAPARPCRHRPWNSAEG